MSGCLSRGTALRTTVCILLVLIPFGAAFWLNPKVEGDGMEYLLTQESLKNHGSTEFRNVDEVSFHQLVQHESIRSTSTEGWFRTVLKENIDAGKTNAGGYVLCKDGAYRSYHFWAYSLVSLPFRVFCDWSGIDPVYSFGILHALLLACVVWLICRSSCFTYAERWGLAVGLLFLCTVFYFNWVHPEIFSTTFLAMGIVRFLERKPASALVLTAIAALQNQPIALALPLFYLAHGLQNQDERPFIQRLFFPFTQRGQWVLTGLAVLIVLLPSIYYIWRFGHPNPIAAIGGLSPRLITLSRLFSLWFDINQGVVTGFPGLIAGVLILLPVACFFRKRRAGTDLFDAVSLLLVSLLISIPCLIQGNWNAGCATMIRYGLWIGIPLPFVVALLLRYVGNPFKSLILLAVILLQLWVPTYCGYPAKTRYIKLNPLSVWIINRFPQWYNPDPEIFAERVSWQEDVLRKHNLFVWKRNGRVKKILSRHSPLDAGNFWGNQEFYSEASPSSTVTMRDGWTYTNGDFLIKRSGEYTIRYDDPTVDWRSWSVVESGFRWSLGQESAILFPLPLEKGTILSGLFRIQMNTRGNNQYVEIYLNGKKLFSRTVLGLEELTLQYRPDWIHGGELNELTFKVPNITKPPSNGDLRMIGVKFMNMTFQTISDD